MIVVDDHPAVLRHVAQLLSGPYNVVATFETGADLIPALGALRPHAIVLDITLPGENGIEIARRVKAMLPALPIVFLTVHEDVDYVRVALATGAAGYVIKARLGSDLIPALQAALAGAQFVSPFARGQNLE